MTVAGHRRFREHESGGSRRLRVVVHDRGLPGPEIELRVQLNGETVGWFVLTPTPGWPISRERRVVAVALAD